MGRYPDSRLRVLVLWSPILQRDNKFAAERATAFLPDTRAAHFWDLWGFGTKTYTQQLRYPPGELAWDIFLVYKPQLKWSGRPPDPTVWMQHRGLDIGPDYTQEKLEKELQAWLK